MPTGAAGIDADVLVVGAGIVGLASARALQQHGAQVLVVDKEPDVGAHQTGHNSGVLHAGVYYPPGSAKAELCRRGRSMLVDYCRERGIAHELCGKVVVAVSPDEVPALAELERRCRANGLDVERLDPAGLHAVEPHVAGVAALRVPASGIVDFGAVTRALRADVEAAGGEVRLGTAVLSGRADADGVSVETGAGRLRTRAVLNCAGLHSDRVAAALGTEPRVRIVPFRGEYHELRPERAGLVRALVYPVPDPRLPFLGVHATRGIDGTVHVGPNAVPALSREGYRWRDAVAGDVVDLLRWPGSRRLARRYWRSGATEIWRSLSRGAFTRALQRLLPEVQATDLVPAPAGVRAQALGRDGRLVDDFVFEPDGDRVLHVLNAPSPAATASLAIGEVVANRLLARRPS